MFLTGPDQLFYRVEPTQPFSDYWTPAYNPGTLTGLAAQVCSHADAERLATMIGKLTSMEDTSAGTAAGTVVPAVITDVAVSFNDLEIPYQFYAPPPNPPVHCYQVGCQINGQVALFTAAPILIRQLYPNPFEDKNPDTTVGGPRLILQSPASGEFNLRWGKAES
jgi:hypothetical protein